MALAHLIPIWFSMNSFFTPSSPHSFSSVTLPSLLVLKHRPDTDPVSDPLPRILPSQASIALTTHLQVFAQVSPSQSLWISFEACLHPQLSWCHFPISTFSFLNTYHSKIHQIIYLVPLPGNSFQYSCLGNPLDRGAWQAIVHGVTKVSDTT